MTSPELALRSAAMAWLDGRPRQMVDFAWLSTFEYDGERISLKDRGRGIRKPAQLTAALSITTTFIEPGKTPPYADAIGTDGLQRYKYQGENPQQWDNVALRRAYLDGLPVIWFVGIGGNLYEPIYPVWVVGDDPNRLEFTLALDALQKSFDPSANSDMDTRRYMERITKRRLHQRVFSSQVLYAYEGRCAVCNLGHRELLDAAHIVSDGKPLGQPVVTNGLAMCKIHHAAFDNSILGIRPDSLRLHIRQDILREIDGPMLRHGLQDMHGQPLMKLPRSKAAQPDPERLEIKYEEFLNV